MSSVCFACGTEFHLLVTYIISTTVYKDSKKILIIRKSDRTNEFINNAIDIGIWEKVIIIDPKESIENYTDLFLNLIQAIDILHFFSWGFPLLNTFYARCIENNKKIILTDEGLLTYTPYKNFIRWSKENCFKDNKYFGFDIEKIDEIWLFNPNLYNDKIFLPIKLISIETFYSEVKRTPKLVNYLKSLFNISKDFHFDYEIIYFRTHHFVNNNIYIEADVLIDRCISLAIKNFKSIIKNHPAQTNENNQNINSTIYRNKCPWEVIVLLSIIGDKSVINLPKVYISSTSSAMFKSMDFGCTGSFIFINKLIEDYTGCHHGITEGLIIKNIDVLKRTDVYMPLNWRQFKDQFEKALNQNLLQIENKTVLNFLNIERDFLKQEFLYNLKINQNNKVLQKERDRQIAERDRQLNEIKRSKTWKVALLLRRMRKIIAPKNSLRAIFLKWLYKTTVFPIIKIRRKRNFKKSIKAGWAGGSAAEVYQKWIEINEPTKDKLEEQRHHSGQFPLQPLISIVVPVYNPPIAVLESMLQSVVQQTYPNWELCIANGDRWNRNVKNLLAKFTIEDKRIRISHLNQNLGIAGNTNAAISMANGEYVAFLDHDDTLAQFALFEVVSSINKNPGADIFFSDEDKVTEKGERFDPFFKPGFSPDFLRSVNYMCHFLVVRKSLGEQNGWLRNGFEGAQDHDFILRMIEKTIKVVRIPKILYHWRSIQGSAASETDAKPYAKASGQKALVEHLQRTGLSDKAEINLLVPGYNVQYDLSEQPLISIIIPNRDHAVDLKSCVDSIIDKSTYSNFEILIVENNSRQADTLTLYEQLKKMETRISVIKWKKPFNYSQINNWAVQKAKGKVLLFLNNDIEIISTDWLEQMLMHVLRPEIGAVGAKLYYPDGNIQHAGVIVGLGGVGGHGHKNFPRNSHGYFGQLKLVRNVAANTAACLMVRRKVFEEVNGFDEKYVLAFGDVDLCLKISEKGYLNLWTPQAELYHHESKTRGQEDTLEQQERFRREVIFFKHKWASYLKKGDPYYNPNLTQKYEDYSLIIDHKK